MYFVKPNKTGSGAYFMLLGDSLSTSLSIENFFQNIIYELFGELNNTKCHIAPGWMTHNIHYLYWETVLIQNKNLCQWMYLNYKKKKGNWQNYEITLPQRGK